MDYMNRLSEYSNDAKGVSIELIDMIAEQDVVQAVETACGGARLASLILREFDRYMHQYQTVLTALRKVILRDHTLIFLQGKNTARKDILYSLLSGYPVEFQIRGVLTESGLKDYFDALGFRLKEQKDIQYEDTEHPENLFLQKGNLIKEYLDWLSEYIQTGYQIDEFVRVYEAAEQHEKTERTPVFLSIVMRTQGKRPETLREVLQSLTSQECLDFEVLLMGHKLNEEQQALVEMIRGELPAFMRDRVRIVRVDHGNRTTPINIGFEEAAGEYITILDDDDLVFSNWVSSYKEKAEKKAGAILHAYVASQSWMIHTDEKGRQRLSACGSMMNQFCKDFHYLTQIKGNYCPVMGLAFPSYPFKKFGFRFDETLDTTEDWDFLMRVSAVCGVVDIPVPTSLYRLWDNVENSYSLHEREIWRINHEKIQEKFKTRPLLVPKEYQEVILKALEKKLDIFDDYFDERRFDIGATLYLRSDDRYREKLSLNAVTEGEDKVMIKAEDVAIRFNLSSERFDSFKEYVIKAVKGQVSHDEFWALKGVSFELKQGDSLGLIGLNGSGKSTMLKIIAGVLKPTRGTVEVNGQVAPLIELGAGFDMDLTARENVYLNGALLGYSKDMMDEHYDDIVDFSELSEFMDVPVKNFSSGMVSRLAFAIATIGTPDILIVDEVLSVGDFHFQEKCEKRIKKMMGADTTILFVSHSIDQVMSLCNKIVWLEKGNVKMFGDAKKVCAEYSES